MRSIDDKSPSALQSKVLEQSSSKKIAALETLFDIQPGKQQGDQPFGQYLSQFIQDSKTKKVSETLSKEAQKGNRPSSTIASSKPSRPQTENKVSQRKENTPSTKDTEASRCQPVQQEEHEGISNKNDETTNNAIDKAPEKTESLTAEQLLAATLSTTTQNPLSSITGNFSTDKTLLQANASAEDNAITSAAAITIETASTGVPSADANLLKIDPSSRKPSDQALPETVLDTATEFKLDTAAENISTRELPKETAQALNTNTLLGNGTDALDTGSLSELIKIGSQAESTPLQGVAKGNPKTGESAPITAAQSQSTDSIDINALLASGQSGSNTAQDSGADTQAQNFSGVESIEALSDSKPTTNTPSINPAVNGTIKVATDSKSNVALSNQVIEGIQQAARSGDEIKLTGKKEVVMQLEPEHLGQLRITLNSNHNQEVSARIITNNRETQEVLKNQIAYLKESLEQQGVQLSKVTVIYTGNESNTDLGQFQQQLNQQNTQAFQQFQNQHHSQHNQTNGLSHGPRAQTEAQDDPIIRGNARSPLSQQNDLGQISLLV